jgi:hypothetical protein
MGLSGRKSLNDVRELFGQTVSLNVEETQFRRVWVDQTLVIVIHGWSIREAV